MPQNSIQLCRKGAELNRSCRFRHGNVINLPEMGKVIVAGDLHGHRRNFERIRKIADLENNPWTHVVLQEIIHGGPEDDYGGCLSWQLLFDAIRYKISFPDQVHILLGNHDTAAITNSSVLKAGKEMNRALQAAMQRQFEKHYDTVYTAMVDYLLSQPLAVRCPNRIWLSHSLPADDYLETFDLSIFNRPYTLDDIERPNPVYLLTWGRRHSEKTLARLAQMLDVDVFVLGHQPQENGWLLAGFNTLIIASEHAFGCVLCFDLDKPYTAPELTAHILPLNCVE
ncbi:MAG: metallophosphoesterase [Planctomycetales bacterium]|nr:metallophosphoesterase [Planctomycetales bacterium]